MAYDELPASVNLTLKNVPRAVYERLRLNALRNRRSLNNEAIVRLEQALGMRRVSAEEELARIDALRNSLRVPPLTPEMLVEWIEEGRP